MSRSAAAPRTVRVPGEPEQASQPAAGALVGGEPDAPAEGGQPFNPDPEPEQATTEPSLAEVLARLEAAEKRAAAAEAEAAALRAPAAATAPAPSAAALAKRQAALPQAHTVNANTIKSPVQTAQGWIVPAPHPVPGVL